eukprot:53571-Eustigmatos_ZCMA.PRE.1
MMCHRRQPRKVLLWAVKAPRPAAGAPTQARSAGSRPPPRDLHGPPQGAHVQGSTHAAASSQLHRAPSSHR